MHDPKTMVTFVKVTQYIKNIKSCIFYYILEPKCFKRFSKTLIFNWQVVITINKWVRSMHLKIYNMNQDMIINYKTKKKYVYLNLT